MRWYRASLLSVHSFENDFQRRGAVVLTTLLTEPLGGPRRGRFSPRDPEIESCGCSFVKMATQSMDNQHRSALKAFDRRYGYLEYHSDAESSPKYDPRKPGSDNNPPTTGPRAVPHHM
eukprot:CAMPEP_0201132260 /NCGR_PEP_ID=MMETSP0850-20130426/45274_1 /ASSEMBLY_ACC=CAM_ASM_000622 /TAXON_ID=183588 /ORGANISM="Pseudo-nitzschia fraudulenta, Strain WWA7" /LENGTH=117 /DNA_ID=CAMNT_0047402555 /DNA_START=96 /DNA_END=446 /DNA_ORIENTATION=+